MVMYSYGFIVIFLLFMNQLKKIFPFRDLQTISWLVFQYIRETMVWVGLFQNYHIYIQFI